MKTSPSTHERNRLRQSLVNLASLLVMALLACGLVSLFALWSMERLHSRTEAAQIQLLQAVNDARTAQVSFKIQVQSWKNLLIRGDVPAEYQSALQDFEKSEQSTKDSLVSLGRWAASVDDKNLEKRTNDLIVRHKEIGEAYRAAMPLPISINRLKASADAAVRGIDRPLNQDINDLAAEIIKKNSSEGERQRQEEHERFSTLSLAIWISIGLSLLLVSSLLWRTLRDPALRR